MMVSLSLPAIHSSDALALIATGQLHSVAPNRLLMKKIVLSGIPKRVHKQKAVVSEMFFDVRI